MLIGRISGATRVLGKPGDMTDEQCQPLAIKDVVHADGTHAMISAWLPTPHELALLNMGASVHLLVVGTAHPPVYVGVDPDVD